MASVPVVSVPVKSAWYSKVNWIALASAFMSVTVAEVTAGAFGLDDATKVQVLFALNMITGVVTIITKTWFTPGVIVNSLPAAVQATLK